LINAYEDYNCVGKASSFLKRKVLCKIKKTATGTFKMFKSAYGEKSLSRKNVFEWHKRLDEGYRK
jgi:hypothetical protein